MEDLNNILTTFPFLEVVKIPSRIKKYLIKAIKSEDSSITKVEVIGINSQ